MEFLLEWLNLIIGWVLGIGSLLGFVGTYLGVRYHLKNRVILKFDLEKPVFEITKKGVDYDNPPGTDLEIPVGIKNLGLELTTLRGIELQCKHPFIKKLKPSGQSYEHPIKIEGKANEKILARFSVDEELTESIDTKAKLIFHTTDGKKKKKIHLRYVQ